MNAMILAAGKGTRMRPLTLTTPKPLLSVGGRPLIEYHLQALQRLGLQQVVINTAWLGETLESALGDGARFGLQLRYSREETPLETLGGLRQALPLLDQGDWILLINGDVWCDFDPADLLPPPTAPTRARLVLVDNPPHHSDGDFFLTDDGRVKTSGGDCLTFAGISLLHRDLITAAPADECRLGAILRDACERGEVDGVHHRGAWFDVGTPERLETVDQHVRQYGQP